MFNKKFEETMSEITNSGYDEKTTIFLKSALVDLAMEHVQDMKSLESKYKSRIEVCENRLDQMEEQFQKLEKELFEDDEDAEFEPITCPYCNANFMVQRDHSITELECPECKNAIILDWGAFDDDM